MVKETSVIFSAEYNVLRLLPLISAVGSRYGIKVYCLAIDHHLYNESTFFILFSFSVNINTTSAINCIRKALENGSSFDSGSG